MPKAAKTSSKKHQKETIEYNTRIRTRTRGSLPNAITNTNSQPPISVNAAAQECASLSQHAGTKNKRVPTSSRGRGRWQSGEYCLEVCQTKVENLHQGYCRRMGSLGHETNSGGSSKKTNCERYATLGRMKLRVRDNPQTCGGTVWSSCRQPKKKHCFRCKNSASASVVASNTMGRSDSIRGTRSGNRTDTARGTNSANRSDRVRGTNSSVSEIIDLTGTNSDEDNESFHEIIDLTVTDSDEDGESFHELMEEDPEDVDDDSMVVRVFSFIDRKGEDLTEEIEFTHQRFNRARRNLVQKSEEFYNIYSSLGTETPGGNQDEFCKIVKQLKSFSDGTGVSLEDSSSDQVHPAWTKDTKVCEGNGDSKNMDVEQIEPDTKTPDPVKTETNQTDPIREETDNTDAISAATGTTHPIRAEAEKTHPISAGADKTHPVSAETGTTHPIRAEADKTHPIRAESGTTHPARAEAGTIHPISAETGTIHPISAETGTIHPISAETGTIHPISAETGTTHPARAEAGTTHPISAEAGTIHPISAETGTIHPISAETGTIHLIREEIATSTTFQEETDKTHPIRTQTGTTHPVSAETGTIDPIREETGTGDPMRDKTKKNSHKTPTSLIKFEPQDIYEQSKPTTLSDSLSMVYRSMQGLHGKRKLSSSVHETYGKSKILKLTDVSTISCDIVSRSLWNDFCITTECTVVEHVSCKTAECDTSPKQAPAIFPSETAGTKNDGERKANTVAENVAKKDSSNGPEIYTVAKNDTGKHNTDIRIVIYPGREVITVAKTDTARGTNTGTKTDTARATDSANKSDSVKGTNYVTKSDTIRGTNTVSKTDGVRGTNTLAKADSARGKYSGNKTDSVRGTHHVDRTDAARGTNSANKTDSVKGTHSVNRTDCVRGTNCVTKTDSVRGTNSVTKTDSVRGTNTVTKTDCVRGTNSVTKTDSVRGTNSVTKTDCVRGTNSVTKTDCARGINSVTMTDSVRGTNSVTKKDSARRSNSVTVTDSVRGTNTVCKTHSVRGTHSVNRTNAARGTNSVTKTDTVRGTSSATKTDSVRGTNTVAKSDTARGTNTVTKTDSVRGTNTVTKTDSVRGTNTVDKTDSVRGTNTVAKPDSVRGTNTVAKPDSVRGTHSANKTDSVKGTNSANKTDSVRGTNTVGKTDSVSGTHSANKTDSVRGTDSANKTDSVRGTNSVYKTNSVRGTNSAKKTDSVRGTNSVAKSDTARGTNSCTKSDTSRGTDTVVKTDSAGGIHAQGRTDRVGSVPVANKGSKSACGNISGGSSQDLKSCKDPAICVQENTRQGKRNVMDNPTSAILVSSGLSKSFPISESSSDKTNCITSQHPSDLTQPLTGRNLLNMLLKETLFCRTTSVDLQKNVMSDISKNLGAEAAASLPNELLRQTPSTTTSSLTEGKEHASRAAVPHGPEQPQYLKKDHHIKQILATIQNYETKVKTEPLEYLLPSSPKGAFPEKNMSDLSASPLTIAVNSQLTIKGETSLPITTVNVAPDSSEINSYSVSHGCSSTPNLKTDVFASSVNMGQMYDSNDTLDMQNTTSYAQNRRIQDAKEPSDSVCKSSSNGWAVPPSTTHQAGQSQGSSTSGSVHKPSSRGWKFPPSTTHQAGPSLGSSTSGSVHKPSSSGCTVPPSTPHQAGPSQGSSTFGSVHKPSSSGWTVPPSTTHQAGQSQGSSTFGSVHKPSPNGWAALTTPTTHQGGLSDGSSTSVRMSGENTWLPIYGKNEASEVYHYPPTRNQTDTQPFGQAQTGAFTDNQTHIAQFHFRGGVQSVDEARHLLRSVPANQPITQSQSRSNEIHQQTGLYQSHVSTHAGEINHDKKLPRARSRWDQQSRVTNAKGSPLVPNLKTPSSLPVSELYKQSCAASRWDQQSRVTNAKGSPLVPNLKTPSSLPVSELYKQSCASSRWDQQSCVTNANGSPQVPNLKAPSAPVSELNNEPSALGYRAWHTFDNQAAKVFSVSTSPILTSSTAPMISPSQKCMPNSIMIPWSNSPTLTSSTAPMMSSSQHCMPNSIMIPWSNSQTLTSSTAPMMSSSQKSMSNTLQQSASATNLPGDSSNVTNMNTLPGTDFYFKALSTIPVLSTVTQSSSVSNIQTYSTGETSCFSNMNTSPMSSLTFQTPPPAQVLLSNLQTVPAPHPSGPSGKPPQMSPSRRLPSIATLLPNPLPLMSCRMSNPEHSSVDMAKPQLRLSLLQTQLNSPMSVIGPQALNVMPPTVENLCPNQPNSPMSVIGPQALNVIPGTVENPCPNQPNSPMSVIGPHTLDVMSHTVENPCPNQPNSPMSVIGPQALNVIPGTVENPCPNHPDNFWAVKQQMSGNVNFQPLLTSSLSSNRDQINTSENGKVRFTIKRHHKSLDQSFWNVGGAFPGHRGGLSDMCTSGQKCLEKDLAPEAGKRLLMGKRCQDRSSRKMKTVSETFSLLEELKAKSYTQKADVDLNILAGVSNKPEIKVEIEDSPSHEVFAKVGTASELLIHPGVSSELLSQEKVIDDKVSVSAPGRPTTILWDKDVSDHLGPPSKQNEMTFSHKIPFPTFASVAPKHTESDLCSQAKQGTVSRERFPGTFSVNVRVASLKQKDQGRSQGSNVSTQLKPGLDYNSWAASLLKHPVAPTSKGNDLSSLLNGTSTFPPSREQDSWSAASQRPTDGSAGEPASRGCSLSQQHQNSDETGELASTHVQDISDPGSKIYNRCSLSHDGDNSAEIGPASKRKSCGPSQEVQNAGDQESLSRVNDSQFSSSNDVQDSFVVGSTKSQLEYSLPSLQVDGTVEPTLPETLDGGQKHDYCQRDGDDNDASHETAENNTNSDDIETGSKWEYGESCARAQYRLSNHRRINRSTFEQMQVILYTNKKPGLIYVNNKDRKVRFASYVGGELGFISPWVIVMKPDLDNQEMIDVETVIADEDLRQSEHELDIRNTECLKVKSSTSNTAVKCPQQMLQGKTVLNETKKRKRKSTDGLKKKRINKKYKSQQDDLYRYPCYNRKLASELPRRCSRSFTRRSGGREISSKEDSSREPCSVPIDSNQEFQRCRSTRLVIKDSISSQDKRCSCDSLIRQRRSCVHSCFTCSRTDTHCTGDAKNITDPSNRSTGGHRRRSTRLIIKESIVEEWVRTTGTKLQKEEIAQNPLKDLPSDADATPSQTRMFYVCGSTCGFSSLYGDELKMHASVCTLPGALDCHHCGFTASDEDSLVAHVHNHSDRYGNLHECSVPNCEFETNVLHSYQTHVQEQHPLVTRHVCNDCKSVYSDMDGLIQHVHDNLLLIVWCKYCDAIACEEKVILDHIEKVHQKTLGIWTMNELLCGERKSVAKLVSQLHENRSVGVDSLPGNFSDGVETSDASVEGEDVDMVSFLSEVENDTLQDGFVSNSAERIFPQEAGVASNESSSED